MRLVEVTRFGGPEVLKAREAADPVPEPGQLVVDVSEIEVLFLDTQLRSGWGKDFFPMEPPFVPGAGVGGTVSSVGEGVEPAWGGRQVVARTGNSGAYVTRAAVSAGEVFEVPYGLGARQALASLHDGVTALSRLEKARIQPGKRVLVNAAGGSLGLWLVPLARAAGAKVLAAARGEEKLAHARELGAQTVVDYSEPDWLELVRHATGDEGVDVVFDGTGGQVGRAAFELTARSGRFFSYGAASGDFAAIGPEEASRREITLVGINDPLFAEDWRRLTKRALSELAAGTVRPVIGQAKPLDRAADAHAAMEAREVIGKTLLLA